MQIFAGKNYASRYDNRACVHIGVADSAEDEPHSICAHKPIHVNALDACVDITCKNCATALQESEELKALGPGTPTVCNPTS